MRPATTTTGFSLSPGGLLLPYHMGALEALEHHQQLDLDQTPLAGSSAGSIAVAAMACGIRGPQVLEATSQIADECTQEGGTRGRLLGKLRTTLNELITDEHFQVLQERPIVIAHQQVLPTWTSRHETSFASRQDLIQAICHSSSFPFFTTNWPCVLDTSRRGRVPRLVVDGFFAVPRERFGCPDFALAHEQQSSSNNNKDTTAFAAVDRTVFISVFPRDKIGIDAADPEDCISPAYRGVDQMQNLLRLATQSASRQEYAAVYEDGWKDAEQWCQRQQEQTLVQEEDSATTALN
ncbi:Patatin-like phospholipase domain containing [Seminavis robusta]|uniref:Patatin-like phospholipase domain containing n=1 Tax=Seminavis robusta TaxID=568900 RepID=A0A9N8HAT2_9STRA|nr:Patatin-like phospholipase domain containing [Seminavis robusta]|eukprot:Sro159_g071860.1 Patatin-like phospholipase domain containing (294) ;mRNA; r:65738-66619